MSTIDPGLDETIKQTSNDVDPEMNPNDVMEQEQQEADDVREPSRWWFASTAIPLLAATFGPIANGFSICALVYSWRLYIPPGGTEEHGVRLQDPSWLLALNGVSLAFAVIGNSTLLLNMARRLRFELAQPLTISGFLLAGIFLIVDMATLTASPTYHLTGENADPVHHALSEAFYYAIFAASIYLIIALLMCLNVYGSIKGYYEKNFQLTRSQRTLMLQTMLFVAYLLLGALVFSTIEGWNYLPAVYWADVTVLIVGFGSDYAPKTNVGRGLLFPFALGGILIIGLVIGSIRSLVLERGKEKLGARITEKRRETAIHNVDVRHQTIRIGFFAREDFSIDPGMSSAQRREEEFNIMRKVQDTAMRERRWFALAMSGSFALILWFGGAGIFMRCERNQQWTYFDALYFTYVSLLTIGYGDLILLSNAGRAFFVVWSLLAVPSLTILISNMGDTIVSWFSNATLSLGKLTVLPEEKGFRDGIREALEELSKSFRRISPLGIVGDAPQGDSKEDRIESGRHHQEMHDRIADRLTRHLEQEELQEAEEAERRGDPLDMDIHFYHYVLARESGTLQEDLILSPPKKYSWQEWEYFLKLIGTGDDPEELPGERAADALVPEPLKPPEQKAAEKPGSNSSGVTVTDSASDAPAEKVERPQGPEAAQTDGVIGRRTELGQWTEAHQDHSVKKRLKQYSDRTPGRKRQRTTADLQDWSWLSNKSPLMSQKTETEWILQRISAALERELNRQRKGYKRQPPISMDDVRTRSVQKRDEGGDKEQFSDKEKSRGDGNRKKVA